MHPISYRSFTFALAEETSPFTSTVLVPSNAREGDHVLIKPAEATADWYWGVLTYEVSRGSDTWFYKRVSREEVMAYIEQDIRDHEFQFSACPVPDTLAQ